MFSPSVAPSPGPSHSFSHLLKTWRRKRRLSQLDLALHSGVSQRHISFLESGRANPSREMIHRISETLDIPLRERNTWLVAAGFAPIFQARPLDDPQMTQVMTAIRLMLSNHEPYPAVAVDRAWNVRLANAPFQRLLTLFGPRADSTSDTPPNLLRLFFHPQGIRPIVANWSAIAPLLWCRAQREAAATAGEDMRLILAELTPHLDKSVLSSAEDTALLPVLPIKLAIDSLQLSLFSVISTFGTAQDVTADELRIESFFPADDATARIFQQSAPPPPASCTISNEP